MLRGLARSAGHWGDFAPRFRTAFPGATVDTPDLPGCGVSHGERSPGDVAQTVAAVRACVGGDGPLWLVGLSLGGMVAYEWALRHPEQVAGLVLINSSLGGLTVPWRRLRWSAAGQILAAAVTTDPLARERRLYALNSNRPELVSGIAQSWAELARREPVRRGNVVRQLWAAARYQAGPPPPVPLLVLVSQGDRMVDPAASRAIAARFPGATLKEHPTAGHDLPLDDPDWVLARIAEWLPGAASERVG